MANTDNQEKEKHIALEAMRAGQSYIESHKDEFIDDMKAYLAKDIKELLKSRNMTDLDNILVASIVLVTGQSAESVTTKLFQVQNDLKSHGVENIILTATFYDLDTKYLFGANKNIEDKTFPRRLDKVTKIIEVENTGGEGGSTTEQEVGFNLNWNNINNWNWADFIEPLNINFTGNQRIKSLKAELSVFPKIAYTYCAIRSAGGSSSFDSLCSDLAFPFWEEQLDQVYYTSQFGPRWSSYHYGVDLAANAGLEIHAAADGVVRNTLYEEGGAGNAVYIKHAGNLVTIYMHMQALEVNEGQQITKGQVIGHVGYTGHCEPAGPDGAHLHFQVNENDDITKNGAVDPAKYFERLGAVGVGSNLGSYKD